MALSHKARKRWSLVILLVGLPLYILACIATVMFFYPDPLERPPLLVELAIYIALGIVWALPFKFVFKGVGQEDPDA